MNKIKIIILAINLIPLLLQAQVMTDPVVPVASKKVTILFNSSSESQLGHYTEDLYAHTGVVFAGSDGWQNVIGNWGNNSNQPKLEYLGVGNYKLVIEPDIYSFYSIPKGEQIVSLAFVFRSADGTRQTNDLFVNLGDDDLWVEITNPAHNGLVELDQPAELALHAQQEADITLYINNEIIAEETAESFSLNHTFTSTGYYWLKAEATAGNETVYDSLQFYVREAVPEEPLPTAYRKGINYPDETSAALVLWAPGKETVFVKGDFNDWRFTDNYQMKKDGDYFWLEVEGLEPQKEYAFQYVIDGKVSVADPYTEKILDPWNDMYIGSDVYPDLLAYPNNRAEGIVSVLQPGQEDYQWEITEFQVPDVQKLIIYELLIRDFTDEHTFEAVREKLDYLQDLNINVLELMPVNEFEGNSSWGYNPAFYFAPDKYYGPSVELKKLIDECHKRGIAVVIDMVLNHSYGQSPFVQMYMDDWTVTPDNPWYNTESNFQNPEARWGYDFNHEAEATRELIDSINSFWINEYKIDGFRFDFTKGFSNTIYGPGSWGSDYDAPRIANLKRMADEIWKRKEDALLILEHLSDQIEEKELSDYGFLLWGNMHGNYKEAARGNSGNSELQWGIHSTRGWNHPHLVSYMESHDEERIMHELYISGFVEGSYNVRDLNVALKRMELMSVFFIPLPGPKMIWQFGERGYDVSINEYGGRLSEKPSRWEYLLEENRMELFEVIAQLNHLKQTYEEFTPEFYNFFLASQARWYTLREDDNYVYTIGNFGTTELATTFSFPVTGRWYEYFTGDSLQVNATDQDITLDPGEYRMYSTRKFEKAEVVTESPAINDKAAEVFVYPNPAKHQISVKAHPEIQGMKIFSSTGNIVFESGHSESNTREINVGNYSPGIYFLQVRQNDKVTTRKFVVE